MSTRKLEMTWIDNDPRTYIPLAFSSAPKRRECFEYGGRLFRTPQAAIKAQAWAMICKKYSTYESMEDIKRVLSMECDCADVNPEDGFRFDCCQLHDRNNGYFARLRSRLIKMLLNKYGYTENWRENKAGGQ